MGRRPEPERRAELLERVVDYVLVHGLADLSLRPLAEATGTSARMLIYHFGSRDGLIAEALGAARDRQQAMLAAWAQGDAEPGLAGLARRFWAWSTDEATRPFLRLFFEVYGLALMSPDAYPNFLEQAVGDWFPFIEEHLRGAGATPEDAETLATLFIAGHRGLLLDLLATGAEARVDRAHSELLAALERRLDLTHPQVQEAIA